ncbi:MAG TPA: aspartate--tRNA ligase, partial [Flavobacteriaceae bacterium]|nr:aspartate--tRNA ligase [Flavobacteriaceae bacterium]
MYRTHNCGELRKSDIGKQVTLSGWVQKMRDKGFMIWVDMRDRYGISQLIFDEQRSSKDLLNQAKSLGREFVIQIHGKVIERASKNQNIPTGDIEILVKELTILNSSTTPPFTIEDNTDGGEELRMKYRYLDIRREPIKKNLILRHEITQQVRKYLSDNSFIEVETPCLIKSTPEGARDFIVPSRINEGDFYALPQSPQTFKQLLMVAGLDKYFQIVKCFRDEDLRADRQPEFTQIDCEMSFVEQDDVLNTFEGLITDIFKKIKKIDINKFPKITYEQAIEIYGTDKPDIRFGMEFVELNDVCQHKDFNVFNSAELVVGIVVNGGNTFTRKEIDKYIDWIKTPQVGAMGMVYLRCNDDGGFKSSVDKFYDQADLKNIAEKTKASKGDLIMILSGDKNKVRSQLGALRLELAKNLGLRNSEEFAPLWVVDFPLLNWDEEENKFHA